ncbi:MAG: spermidine/putrescine ABC transporter permease PotC [Sphingopyxis sp. 65-8]|jgi:spermidine/putrescine transport system permease protein|uniref:ABC transporter permease n=1 Tax=Sphingopyxis terrae TaxID=33052 RepID=UPI0009609963|nr:ABC transporter permease [uncultured Sphingopyxis sp.]KAB2858170.1 MAG: ABC transporter permease [Sphingopyxis terrae]OJW23653.1 MAG: spermidine/putrescine ABC transporter permease PotC [Sphingopyxis sp. 65-8]MBN8804248.1 ABC transporter permease [Sphingopyxis terrae]MBU7588518.1 ABC transporter permease [Sphingopyxis terrae]HRE33620.1 ABC transporter permease [Sphingopyxis terrae]
MAIFSRTPRAPLEYSRTLWMRLWVGAVMVFLYAPLVVLMIFSFNDSKRNVVWRGFTLKYYDKALGNDVLVEALVNSLTIAALATLISLILGAVAAVMLWRFRFPLKGAVDGTISLPIIVPEICMGVAFLIFFAKWLEWPTDLIWPFNLGAIIIAHITFCFPFVTMVVRSRLATFNREQEEAAKDLGAGEWAVFRDVLIPHMRPALIAGALLSFTLSLDDFVITYFTSGPDTITFPVKVYSMVRFSVTPEVNAASTLLILLTILLTAVALKLQGVKAIAETH